MQLLAACALAADVPNMLSIAAAKHLNTMVVEINHNDMAATVVCDGTGILECGPQAQHGRPVAVAENLHAMPATDSHVA